MTVITQIRDYREKGPVTLTLQDGGHTFALVGPREDYIAAGAPARGNAAARPPKAVGKTRKIPVDNAAKAC